MNSVLILGLCALLLALISTILAIVYRRKGVSKLDVVMMGSKVISETSKYVAHEKVTVIKSAYFLAVLLWLLAIFVFIFII